MADGTIERKDVISDDVFKGLDSLELSLKKNVDLIDILTKKAIENSKQIATTTNQAIKNDSELLDLQKRSIQAQTSVFEAQKKVIETKQRLNTEEREQLRLAKLIEKANSDESGSVERLRANIKMLEIERIKMVDVTGKNKDAYTKLISEIERLRAEELSLGTVQDKQRANIGNYKSHWDGLGNSINQITREMPAFAFSVNTGFMALSNNIPMLADQINLLNQRNKELRENGEKTTPVWKTILGSVLSWQTALSVGVTLFTVYGGKMIEWIGNLLKSNVEIEKQVELQKQINDARNQGYKNAVDEKVNLDLLYQISQDQTRSLKERKEAVDMLQMQYPKYFKNLSDESILAGNATKAYNQQSLAILNVAMAEAYRSKIQENANKLVDIEEQLRILDIEDKLINNKIVASTLEEKILASKIQNMDADDKISRLADISLERNKKQIEQYNILTANQQLASKIQVDGLKEYNDLKKAQEDADKKADEERKKRIEDEKKKYEDTINLQIELYKTKFENIKEQTRNLTADEDGYFYNSIEKLKKEVQASQLTALEKQKIINNLSEYQKKINDYELGFIKQRDEADIKSYKDALERQKELANATKEQLQANVDLLVEEANQMQSKDNYDVSNKELELMKSKLENQKLIVESTEDEGVSKEKNLSKLEKEISEITKKQKAKYKELVTDVKDYSSQVNDIINGVYEVQLNDLTKRENAELASAEKRRDANIAAGMAENEANKKYQDEQAAIKRKYAKEEFEIKLKQAKWEKAYALVQIATMTALAIMNAWVKEFTAVAIVKIALIVASAATQTALVLSKPLPAAPEYWKGTNYHQGGLAKVGDRYGRELVTLPDGKQFITPDTDTIIDLPRGTKVDSNAKLRKMLSGINTTESLKNNDENNILLKELLDVTKNKKMLHVDINERGISLIADSGTSKTKYLDNRYRN